MRPVRNNTLVLDTSVLPRRPGTKDIQLFLEQQLKIDISLVTSVQLHNVKNVVYLGMTSMEAAEHVASTHHLKHFIQCDGTPIAIPVPVYVETSAIDVRIHDLPEEFENTIVQKYLEQFGEVISLRKEVWRSFFPGLSNGVRVAKMKLAQPIPSYVTIEGESSLVTYKNQPRTCRHCGQKLHSKQSCKQTASQKQKPQTTNNKQQTNQNRLPISSRNSRRVQ